ncbi:ATP-dependent DNA helicase RecG [Arcanobacterium hippocoleae]|uniref:ATP-dependent DNA helicase RecG n=1 Tax=Arcanobacterium hippocoleae TaxID=149017 RepID=UPI00366FC8D7
MPDHASDIADLAARDRNAAADADILQSEFLPPALKTAESAALISEQHTIIDAPLQKYLPKRSVNALAKLGLETVGDLLWHTPFRLAERGKLMPIEKMQAGQSVTVVARVVQHRIRPMRARRGYLMEVEITDGLQQLTLTFFAKNQRPLNFHAAKLAPDAIAAFSGTISEYRGRLQLQHPEYEILPDPRPEWGAQGADPQQIPVMSEAADSQAEDPPGISLAAAKIGAPIPIYHASAKLPSWQLARAVAALLPLVNEETFPEILPARYLAAHGLPARAPALRSLHAPQTIAEWEKARARMVHEEAFILQTLLAARRAHAASFTAPSAAQLQDGTLAHFDQQLPFTLTAEQISVGAQISTDLSRTTPMRRLLQGDVGTGKTIVALRAMLQMIDSQHQAVLLAPTEVLAEQHYASIKAMLGKLADGGMIGAPSAAISLELVTGSLTAAEKKKAYLRMASGQAQLIIGTHALLEDKIQLPFLGLVVVDEQHRFGVNQRDKLANGAHLLVMTATPIPRTVAMTVFGDLTVSTLHELPKGRKPISTTLVPAWNESWMRRVWQRADEEIASGGRVYAVCPRISADGTAGSEDLAVKIPGIDPGFDAVAKHPVDGGSGSADAGAFFDTLLEADSKVANDTQRELVSVAKLAPALEANPDLSHARIALLHGRLSAGEKAQIMADFQAGKVNLLISTTVIEVGVDVPEATMMVILDADRFGISQLHQLRGRIGRGRKDSLCLAVHQAAAGTLAFARLQEFAATSDGFALAEADLRLRNAGNVLGKQQSGMQSSLRFLNVVQDVEIIQIAKESAARLVASDPKLTAYPDLALEISRVMTANETDYLGKG